MSARRLVALAALIFSAAPLAAQAAGDPLAARLDPATASAVRAIVDSAVAADLPAAPLVNKALEGASKGAAGTRIVLAVRTLATDLRVARGALGSGASEAELVAGVGALRAGAAVEVLSGVKRARGANSALLPLAVLTDLVANGIPVDRAAAVILALAERRAGDAQYRAALAPGPPVEPPGAADAPPGRAAEPPGRVGDPVVPQARPEPRGRGKPAEPPAKGRPSRP